MTTGQVPEFLQSFFEFTSDGLLVLSGSTIIQANYSAQQLLGQTEAKLKGLHIEDLMELKGRLHSAIDWNNFSDTLYLEIKLKLPPMPTVEQTYAGALRPISLTGGARGAVLLFKNTQFKWQIQELMNFSQQNLQKIIETFPDIYYITDAQGLLKKLSPSVKSILGYEVEEVLGTPLRNYYQDTELRDKLIAQVLAANGQYVRLEAPLLHKSGKVVWFNTRARMLYNEQNQVIGLEGLARDVSNEKQMVLQLKEKERQLVDQMLHCSRLASVGVMSAQLSHEYKNLSTILILQTEAAKAQMKDPGVEKYLNRINSTAKKLLELANEYRKFSRGDGKKNERIVVQDLLEELKQLNDLRSKVSPVDLKIVSYVPNPFIFEGSSTQILQLFTNLLNNSHDQLEKNHQKDSWIEIVIDKGPSQISIRITDSGDPISESVAANLFTPFFTTKCKNEGTGLGLVVCKTICEQHHGRIYLDRAIKHPSFVIELPIEQPPETDPSSNGLSQTGES